MRLTAEQNRNYFNYIIDKIDFCDFEKQPTNDQEKVKMFFEVFFSEFDWRVKQIGQQKALAEYLSGLPSQINIPYENWEIIKLAKDMKSIPENATEKQEQKILDNYFNFMASKLIQLKK